MKNIMILILLCVLGFTIGYINAYRWVWQYEVNGIMSPSFEMYKIIVKPSIFPPVGLPTTTKTVLDKKDGIWYANIGDREYRFKEMEDADGK